MSATPSTLTLEDLPLPAALMDAQGEVVEWNSALEGLLDGVAAGRPLPELLEAGGATVVESPAGKLYRVAGADGERILRVLLHPHPRGALAILSDTTAPERAAGPRVAADVQARLMHDAEIGAWRYDPDTETYYFPTELSLGHSETGRPVPLQTLRLLQHPDDRAIDDAIRDQITLEGGAAESEMRYLAGDGGWTHLRVLYRSGERLPSGRYEMHGVSQSITSLARARDAAKASADRLAVALKASRAGVFEYDYAKQAFWFSPEVMALVGEAGMSIVETNPVGIYHPDDHERILEMWRQAPEDQSGVVDVRLLRADGDVWVRLYVEVQRDADGAPLRTVGLMIDVDAAKRQELALEEARRQAEEATAAKSDFLASVSHEIRTPMNGVVGVLNLLGREPLSDEARGLLAEARGCAEMLSELINDVLDFSKIEAGKLTLSPSATDPAAIVESVVRLLTPQAQQKRLTLRAEVAPGLGWADLDAVRLRQCLFNIVGNAVKFTERGHVVVRASARGAGASRRLRFEVEDTGIGVPDEARERLFGRFQQAETGATRRFGGTGLGLAITRQLTRLMGGDLDYESREGQGSMFWFEVAAPAAAAPEAAAEDAGQGTPLSGLQVLVVDDNRVNRLVAVKSLEALGASAQAVESGVEAIAAVAAGGFDLVLMDVNMPGMDGLEASRRIRALSGPASEVPILALTADVMRQQQKAYLAAGMNGMAPKPFSPLQLMTAIAALADAQPEARTA